MVRFHTFQLGEHLTNAIVYRVKVHLYQEDLQEVKRTRLVTHLNSLNNLPDRPADSVS